MGATIEITVSGGPSITVPWTQGLNVQQALEAAYDIEQPISGFTYALQYFGHAKDGTYLGYLVSMINETFESFVSNKSMEPFFYWNFEVNGQVSNKGIDSVQLNDGDVVTFTFETYDESQHKDSTVQVKHERRVAGSS